MSVLGHEFTAGDSSIVFTTYWVQPAMPNENNIRARKFPHIGLDRIEWEK